MIAEYIVIFDISGSRCNRSNSCYGFKMIFILYFCWLCFVCAAKQKAFTDTIRIVIRSQEMFLDDITQSLKDFDFYYDSRINDKLYIFGKKTNESENYQLSSMELTDLRQSNIHIEQLAQSYVLYPDTPVIAKAAAYTIKKQRSATSKEWQSNFMNMCPPFFDLGLAIDTSWREHHVSGRGIVVGVMDVGINTKNVYIKENINLDLSYNFVDNNPNTFPTILPGIFESLKVTNHGNACAGLIARPKTDDVCIPCGLGVAYNAKVADLQIAKIQEKNWMSPPIDSAIYVRALAHKPDAIHIYSNSWASTHPFRKSVFYEAEVLKEGLKNGRNGLGSVYVIPAGQPGSGLANCIGSIPVACMDVNGSVARVSYVNAATLVSVFCNGRRRLDERMITTGHNDRRCFTEFGGESAGTAIVSGMIALLLEANSGLSTRDISHILVESSSYIGIEASPEFLRNGAGKYYHPRLGFGYPSNSKMIRIGKLWNRIPPLCSRTLVFSKFSYQDKSADWYVRVLYDDTFCDTSPCIKKMEEVLFEIEFVYSEQHHMKLWATSPSGTVSELASMEPRWKLKGDGIKRVLATFRSNHFWGEDSDGRWHFYIGCNVSKESEYQYYNCHVVSVRLMVYGTTENRQPICKWCDADTGPVITHGNMNKPFTSNRPKTTEGTTKLSPETTFATGSWNQINEEKLVSICVGVSVAVLFVIIIAAGGGVYKRNKNRRTTRDPNDITRTANMNNDDNEAETVIAG